jgi:hypothetical protein
MAEARRTGNVLGLHLFPWLGTLSHQVFNSVLHLRHLREFPRMTLRLRLGWGQFAWCRVVLKKGIDGNKTLVLCDFFREFWCVDTVLIGFVCSYYDVGQ